MQAKTASQHFSIAREFVGHEIGRTLWEHPQIPNYTEASITARTFLESRGFKTIRKQEVERRGQTLVNYIMEKTIT